MIIITGNNKRINLNYHTLDKLHIIMEMENHSSEEEAISYAIQDYADQVLIRKGKSIEADRNRVNLIRMARCE